MEKGKQHHYQPQMPYGGEFDMKMDYDGGDHYHMPMKHYGYGGDYCHHGYGRGFALIVVLFLLLIIVGAACIGSEKKG